MSPPISKSHTLLSGLNGKSGSLSLSALQPFPAPSCLVSNVEVCLTGVPSFVSQVLDPLTVLEYGTFASADAPGHWVQGGEVGGPCQHCLHQEGSASGQGGHGPRYHRLR